MGALRDAFIKQQSENPNGYYGVKAAALSTDAEAIGKQITDRVTTWLKNNDVYFANAKNRFAENRGYLTDSSDWLTKVTTQRDNFQKHKKPPSSSDDGGFLNSPYFFVPDRSAAPQYPPG